MSIMLALLAQPDGMPVGADDTLAVTVGDRGGCFGRGLWGWGDGGAPEHQAPTAKLRSPPSGAEQGHGPGSRPVV